MKLLITGAWGHTSEQLNKLQSLGYDICFLQNEQDAIPCGYAEIEAVICNGLFLYHPIERFTSLKLIQLTSAGLDRIPLDYINSNGIKIFNAFGVYSIPMAEFAITSALYFYKQIEFFKNNQRESSWKKHRNLLELFGKTVCIVGCGSVGSECAKRFKAFGCTLLGVDRIKFESDMFDCVYSIDAFSTAVSKSDIIVLSVALTEQTHHIFDENILSKIKDNAVLINISRGAVIDESALKAELKKNRFYAALDVFESEPISENDELWKMENVLATPHNSFVGEGNQDRLWDVIYRNLEGFVDG